MPYFNNFDGTEIESLFAITSQERGFIFYHHYFNVFIWKDS